MRKAMIATVIVARIFTLLFLVATSRPAGGQHVPRPMVLLPEQRSIAVRGPARLSSEELHDLPAPPTVSNRMVDAQEIPLTLDNAIRIALENSEVVRILTGVSAASSGRTIYDVAIANTAIDEQQGPFDPFIGWQHSFNRIELPSAVFDPASPNQARIDSARTDDYGMTTDLSKRMMTGGTLNFGLDTNPARFRPGLFPLNPQNRYSLDLSYTQPLFRGGGIGANRAPIVIARIDTERSFFQYKDSVQELVRGVISAYWALVFARTDEWAREQQVKQAEFGYEQAAARHRAGSASRGVAAQARVSLGNFNTTLTAAQNNVLTREAALRNLLGLPPFDGKRVVPVTPPRSEPVQLDWHQLLALAEQNRPDLLELKLIIEADEQRLLLAHNDVNPTVDASMLYRWNGLDGRTPTGANVSTQGSQFTDWSMGVNFSVPITLRRERAVLRRQELVIARDNANLRQGIHNMTHQLAASLRDLEQFFEQYREFNGIRDDARFNLQERRARWTAGGVGGISFLDFLLAITDWGNTISSEAQALAQYNTQLANIERETGTILESHGIRFLEERFGSVVPLGWLGNKKGYAASLPPGPNVDRYPQGDKPSEDFFELDDPLLNRPALERLPPPTSQ